MDLPAYAGWGCGAFRKAGRPSLFITLLSGSILASGNGIVMPKNLRAKTLANLKAVPYAEA